MPDISSLLVTVLSSAITATIVSKCIDIFNEGLKNKISAKYDALTTAVLLEGYAISCADNICDHELAQESHDRAGKTIGSLPAFPNLNVSVRFVQKKKAAIADKLLVLPQLIEQEKQEAAFLWDVSGDPDAVRTTSKFSHAKIGLECLSLAAELRKLYGLQPRKMKIGEYDVFQILIKTRNEEIELENRLAAAGK